MWLYGFQINQGDRENRPVNASLEEQPRNLGSAGGYSHQRLVSSAPPRSEKADRLLIALERK